MNFMYLYRKLQYYKSIVQNNFFIARPLLHQSKTKISNKKHVQQVLAKNYDITTWIPAINLVEFYRIDTWRSREEVEIGELAKHQTNLFRTKTSMEDIATILYKLYKYTLK